MAQFLSNVNLNGNELQKVVLQPLGTAPSALAKVGGKFFNSSEKRESVHDGTKWRLAAYLDDLETLTQDNTELAGVVEQLRKDFDALNKALTEDDTQGIINTWNEISDLVKGLPEGSDLATLIASINSDVQDLQTEVENIKNAATKVEYTAVITEGKQIGTLTIDGQGKTIFAPDTYAWEDITGKTSAKLITVLGFTPFNSANFTKANIKQTLGISDWALESTPPSAATIGAARKVVKTLANTTSTTQDINHGLNDTNVVVSVYDPTNNEQVMVDVKLKDANNITLQFASAPSIAYKVVIVG